MGHLNQGSRLIIGGTCIWGWGLGGVGHRIEGLHMTPRCRADILGAELEGVLLPHNPIGPALFVDVGLSKKSRGLRGS